MEYKKNVIGIREARAIEDAKAENERLKADLEYVAMMADVELDDEEGDEE